MKKIIASSALSVGFFSLSNIAYAVSTVTDLVDASNRMNDYLDLATVLIIAAAVVWLLWNIFKFVMAAGDEEARGKARDGIIYGIIGIAVMMSVWALVMFVMNSAGVGSRAPIAYPTL